MAKSVNRVMLLGRLTRDPELRSTTTGKQIAQLGLAVSRYNSEETDFFDVTAWDKLADLVNQYLSKGSKVLIEGRLQLDRWEKDGQNHSKVTVTATDITFLDSPSDDNAKKNGSLSQTKALEDSGSVAKRDTSRNEDRPIDLSEIPF